MRKVAVLELNELNFNTLGHYVAKGLLPNFKLFLERHGFTETTSEVNYSEVEPWIQWVTVHTGKSFSEHGIFRLGDTAQSEILQIWERLEASHRARVGAVSPMNAANRLEHPVFFVPDPWTPTEPSGSWLLCRVSRAVSKAVNENAANHLTLSSVFYLTLGLARYARPRHYWEYLRLLAGVFRRPWNRVRILDLFLGDLFVSLTRAARPDFSTVFVNGAAHLQHHYLLNSPACLTVQRNPAWYLKQSDDPVGDIYETYDRLLGSVMNSLPGYRVLLVTGLHQDPYPNPIFYWRLRRHSSLLQRLGCRFARVEPRMSRDFLVLFDNRQDLEDSMTILNAARIDGQAAFRVEDRGTDIFVELIYSRDIAEGAALTSGATNIQEFRGEVFFVALKNGHHNSIGYFSDSGRTRGEAPQTMPLTQVHEEIIRLFESPEFAGAP